MIRGREIWLVITRVRYIRGFGIPLHRSTGFHCNNTVAFTKCRYIIQYPATHTLYKSKQVTSS